jgi:predicted nucleic acid-binding protein
MNSFTASEASPRTFVDTNVVLYLLSADTPKADRAEAVVASGCIVSVQVLNEVANVARRKLKMAWNEIEDVLAVVRAVCEVQPLTVETHDLGRALAERHGLSFYDALIVAAALRAGCSTLYTEDLQHDMRVERKLRIVNPFLASTG